MRRNEFLLLTGAALGSLIGPPLIHGWRDNQISRLPALNGLLSVLDWLDERTPEVFQRYRVTLLATCAMAHARLGQVERSAELLRSAAERNERVCSVEKANRIRRVRTHPEQGQQGSADVNGPDGWA